MMFSVLNELTSIEDSKLKKYVQLAQNKKNLAVSIANKFKSNLPGTIITNLGRLEFPEKYGDLILDNMYFISGASTSIPLAISALGVSGKLTLALNVLCEKNEIKVKLEVMEKIKEKALKYLEINNKSNGKK